MYASESFKKIDDSTYLRILRLAVTVAVALVMFLFAFNSLTVHAEEANGKYVYKFTMYDGGKYDVVLSSDYPCVAVINYNPYNYKGGFCGGYLPSDYDAKFYTLDSNNNVVKINPYITRSYYYSDNVWNSNDNLVYEYGTKTVPSNLSQCAFDFGGTNLKCLFFTELELEYLSESDTYNGNYVGENNIKQYLLTGSLNKIPKNTNAFALTNTFSVPKSWRFYDRTNGYRYRIDSTSDLCLNNVSINDNGVITWDTPFLPTGCKFAGVNVFYNGSNFYKSFLLDHSIMVNPNGNNDMKSLVLYPYYYDSNGHLVCCKNYSVVSLDENASYFNRTGEYFTQYAINDAVEGVKPSTDKDYVPSRPHGGGGGNFDNGDRYMSTTTLIASGTKERLDGYEQRNDFYLKNVKVKTGLGGFTKTITWDGTSLDGTLSNIPSSDSLTIATYGMYDSNGEYHVFELDTVETSKGKIKINYSDFIDEMSASPYTWDGLINISPTYKFNHKIFMGRQTVVDLLHGGIKEWYYDDNGEFVDEVIRNDTEDIGDSSSSEDGDGILGSLNDFISSVGSFSQFTGAFFGFLQSVVASMGNFPSLFNTVFGFLPSMYASAIGTFLVVILILRILGR